MATRKKPTEYSEAELMKMQDPLTVRVVEIVSGRKTPIELPTNPGEKTGGDNYSREQIRELASFLVNDWVGGGMYNAIVTDSNGKELLWEIYFDPNKFPKLTSPIQKEAQERARSSQPPVAPSSVPSTQVSTPSPAPSPANGSSLASLGAAYPRVAPVPNQPQPPLQPQTQMQGAYPSWQTPPVVTGNAGMSSDRERVIELQAELKRKEENFLHQRELDEIKARMEKITESKSNPGESEREKRLEEELRAQRETNAQAMVAQQMQQMQQQTMQMFQQMQQQNQQMMQQMQANNEQQLTELRRQMSEGTKSESTMAMILQMMNNQQQTAQQNQQTLVQVMQQASQSQLGPAEILQIFQQANRGTEDLSRNYARVLDMTMHQVEQILGAQGPGIPPMLAMLGEGVQGGLQMAGRWMEMKEQEAAVNAQSINQRARLEAHTKIEQEKIRAAAAAQHPMPEEMKTEKTEEQVHEDALADAEAHVEETGSNEDPVTIVREERELFGEAYGGVQALRRGVADGKLDPPTTAMAILKAVNHFASKADGDLESMPPVFQLWVQKMFPEFVDRCIPQAHPQFRQQVTEAVIMGIQATMQQHQEEQAKAQAVADASMQEQPEASPTS